MESGIAAKARTDFTQILADFAADLKYSDLPDEVIQKAKLLLRDGLGNQLGASTIAEPARVAHQVISEFGGREQATVTGYGTRLPVPLAALLNAMLGHGIELDDAHGRALTKSGSVLIPSVMTVGEHLHRGGPDTLVAAVVGYELMVRIGLAINPGNRKRGFHTTGTVGAIASAGAAAKQYHLGAAQFADALGLGAMQSAGIQAYLDYPCMAKPLSPGKAAFNGTFAAMLASAGFTGPRRALESREGFFNAYSDGLDASKLVDGLGSDFKVMEVGFKPHAACRYAHGPIDAAQRIHGRNDFDPLDIESVTVNMGELAIRQSGRVDVPNLNAAMGSTPFGVALALLQGGNGLADYDSGFSNQDVHRLAKKVHLVPDDSFGLMGRQAVVSVSLRDGRRIADSVDGPKGEPWNPLSESELEEKFLGLAQLAVGPDRAQEINESIMKFEDISDIAGLISQLRKS